MIKGRIELGNEQVFEREFDGVKDFIIADALLYIAFPELNLSYDFYYDDIKIDRLQPKDGEDEVGFPKEIKYLKDMIDIVDNNILGL